MPSDWSGSNAAIVDTNIFVYAHDTSAGEKHERALTLLTQLSNEARLVITTQIVHEFCWTMLRYQRQGRVHFESIQRLAHGMMAFATQVLPLTVSVTNRALYGVERYQFSFWDALIWAAAREWGISTLYTEDFSAGATIEGVRIVNPFTE